LLGGGVDGVVATVLLWVVVRLLALAASVVVVVVDGVVAGVVGGSVEGVTVRLMTIAARLGSVLTWSWRGWLRMLEGDAARD